MDQTIRFTVFSADRAAHIDDSFDELGLLDLGLLRLGRLGRLTFDGGRFRRQFHRLRFFGFRRRFGRPHRVFGRVHEDRSGLRESDQVFRFIGMDGRLGRGFLTAVPSQSCLEIEQTGHNFFVRRFIAHRTLLRGPRGG
jgi:hypothetical protein